MEDGKPTARDLPVIVRAAKCALPIIFTSLDHPEYPGVQGTCTALRFGDEVVFVTAAHVVARSDRRTVVEVALGFTGEPLRARIRDIWKPRPAAERYEGVCDIAVMFPASLPPFVTGESEAYDLARVADMDAPRDSVFAICGYPLGYTDRNIVDYESRKVTFGPHLAFGAYDGPSAITGHHVVQVSTTDIGGPNGFSGSPVFRLLRDEARGAWAPAFAGIVTLGGPDRIIDIAFLGAFLRNEVFRRSA